MEYRPETEAELTMLDKLAADGLQVQAVLRDEETGTVQFHTDPIPGQPPGAHHVVVPAPQIALPPDFAAALAQSLADALAGSVVPVIEAQQQQLAVQAELLAEVTESNRVMRTQLQPVLKESK